MPDKDRKVEAQDLLQQIVDEAADIGADMIEFERVPGELEITYFVGNSGVGSALQDRTGKRAFSPGQRADLQKPPIQNECSWPPSDVEVRVV
jgi:hypothetical protein